MSNLIVEIDNEFILLADGTRIEINMSYDEYGNGNPCGFIIHEAAEQPLAPDVLARCANCNALIETTVHCDNCGTFEPTRR